MPVGDDDAIAVADPTSPYVSRAALKLIAGLDAAEILVDGRICLDLGASTGGFTQVLLERGATRVYAVDVGHGQLDHRVAAEPRVVSIEGVNARDLDPQVIPEPIDLMTCDVSFVSVTKILDAPLSLCHPGAHALILVKPQFEAGREHVGKGGIVTDPDAIEAAVTMVSDFMSSRGWTPIASAPSPIAGGDGNRETILVFRAN